MQIEDAERAGQIAGQISRLQQMVACIDMAVSESWPLHDFRVMAPRWRAERPGRNAAGPAAVRISQPGDECIGIVHGAEILSVHAGRIDRTTGEDLIQQ